MIHVRYAGRLAATVTSDAVEFAPHIDVLESDHPSRRWVRCLASFAGEILTADIQGPYSRARAEHFARCALMPDELFVPLYFEDDALLAEAFNVPIEQVIEKRRDLVARRLMPGH